MQRAYWLDPAGLRQLNPAQYCLLLVHEWLSYEGYENLSSAVYFHPAEVDAQLRQPLGLPEVADCLRAHRRRQDQLRRQYAARPRQQLWNACCADSLLRQHEAAFQRRRPALVARLLAYVGQHLGQFP